MADSRIKNIIRNSITGVLFRVVRMLLPFVVRTVMVVKLGKEYPGLSGLFTSILQVLSLSELGFSAAIAFSMYKPVAEDDKPKICALMNLIRKVYRIIGTIILVVGIALVPFLKYLINGECLADVNLYILYFIYLFDTVVSYFMFAYTSSLLAANQRTDVENVISLVCNTLMNAFQIISLILVKNYYVYVIFFPISTICINLLRYRQVKKLYPELVCKGSIEKSEKKVIYKNIGALAGYKLSNVIISSISNIIITAYFGLEISTIYGNYYLIISSLIALITIIYTSLTASVGNSIVTESVEKNYRDFKTLTFCNVWLIGWVSICLVCLFQPFITIWMGSEFLLPMDTVVLFSVYFYLWKFKDMLSCCYKEAAGMWKEDFLKPYVITIVSLILNIVLVKYWGINGSLVAGIVGFFVISMPWETHVFFKNYLKMKEWSYYLRMLLYTAVIVVVGLLTYFICTLLPETGFLWMLVKGCICLVVPNIIIILLSFKTAEFQKVFGKCKLLLKKIFKRN